VPCYVGSGGLEPGHRTLDEGQRRHNQKDERSHGNPPSSRLSRQANHSTCGTEEEHDVEDDSPLGAPEIEFEDVVDYQLDQREQEHQTEPDEVDGASIRAESGDKQVDQGNHDKKRGEAETAGQLEPSGHARREQSDNQQHIHVCRDCPGQVGSSS
jgi:hypothetical protein